jgi:hypothetical protein
MILNQELLHEWVLAKCDSPTTVRDWQCTHFAISTTIVISVSDFVFLADSDAKLCQVEVFIYSVTQANESVTSLFTLRPGKKW